MGEASKPHSMFSDPEDQAQHEQNLEWLRLAREEPGWILSRLHHLAELEEQLEALRRVIEAISVMEPNGAQLVAQAERLVASFPASDPRGEWVEHEGQKWWVGKNEPPPPNQESSRD